MALVLSDTLIRSRRGAYACCYGDLAWQLIQELQKGKMDCAELTERKMKHVRWALSVVRRTPLSTEDADCKCVSHERACAVIQGADTLCINCGCGCDANAANCAIDANFRVIGTLAAFGDLPVDPDVNDQYLVESMPATVYRWNGTTWVGTAVDDGLIVLDDNGTYYTAYSGQFGHYFPPFTVYDLGGGDFQLIDQYIWVNQNHPTRTVVVEVTADGSTWTTVYSGLVLGANGLIYTPSAPTTGSRVTYTIDGCVYGPFLGEVQTAPEPAAHDIGTSHDFSHG